MLAQLVLVAGSIAVCLLAHVRVLPTGTRGDLGLRAQNADAAVQQRIDAFAEHYGTRYPAALDRASRGWRGFTMTPTGLRLLHDLRRQRCDPPPTPPGHQDQPADHPDVAGSVA